VHKPPPAPRRRYPRARADLRFQPAPSGLALADAHGRQTGPLSFLAALVLTYCDGHHEPRSIADAVAGTITTGDPATVRADVARTLDRFAHDGMLD
jgi:hypothetical protein